MPLGLIAGVEVTVEFFAALVLGVAGLAIGSFLNVVVWRVPRGESVVSPPSACPRCGHRISPRDNVPVLSWLILRGRCRSCAEPISVRYPLVELFTGLAFAGVTLWAGVSWALPAYLYLAAVSIALALIDVDTRRLPDALVKPSYAVGLVLLFVACLATSDWHRLLAAAIGGVGLFALYFVLAAFGGMGFGDVKLAGVLGMYLGWLGYTTLLVGAFGGFVIGGVVSVAALLLSRVRMKSRIPFGPFMLAGAWVGIVAAAPLASWYLSLVGLDTGA